MSTMQDVIGPNVIGVTKVHPVIPTENPTVVAVFWTMWDVREATCKGIAEVIGCSEKETQKALDFLTADSDYQIFEIKDENQPIVYIMGGGYEKTNDNYYYWIKLGKPINKHTAEEKTRKAEIRALEAAVMNKEVERLMRKSA